MRPQDIHQHMKQCPFVPFRFHFSDGSSFDVGYPELIMVSRTVLALMDRRNGGGELPERVLLLDPVHVGPLEPINGKGQAERGT